MISDELLQFDRQHLWHPYTSMIAPITPYPVKAAYGSTLVLEDGCELIDGMASWWSAIHGYNVPEINAALKQQIDQFSHVMFGGLTHRPAVELGKRLVEITPEPLQHVFLADSGSISVEVALKMAIQYWIAQQQPQKNRIATLRRGYHGDTFATMALTDPDNGMHTLFGAVIRKPFFIDAPQCVTDAEWAANSGDLALDSLQAMLEQHHAEIAALILEPIAQGAGGMRFYCPEFLRQARHLCDEFDVLLIADEIATGFGRTGTLFACEQAGIVPDILCVGKALTSGTMTLAATLTTAKIAQAVGVLMHGPTFMGNPLACVAACASIDLLLDSPWQSHIQNLEMGLKAGLAPCDGFAGVKEVRVLGGIGVVELEQPVEMEEIQPMFVEAGIWVRPFGKLVYVMPPYILTEQELETLTHGIQTVLQRYLDRQL